MMLSEAREIALEHIKAMEREAGFELALVDNSTMEKNFGWVFFYTSKKFLERASIKDTIAGNAPFVVGKADGRVYLTGTAFPLEYYLEQLAKVHGWHSRAQGR